jgi:hypothetical protein
MKQYTRILVYRDPNREDIIHVTTTQTDEPYAKAQSIEGKVFFVDNETMEEVELRPVSKKKKMKKMKSDSERLQEAKDYWDHVMNDIDNELYEY